MSNDISIRLYSQLKEYILTDEEISNFEIKDLLSLK